MKKIISVFMCIIMLLGIFTVASAAISVNEGDAALRKLFKGSSNKESGLSYEYFAPTQKTGVKYPLVVWLHGIASGNYDGDQVDSYDLCKWASDEYQARFVNAGGAYILCPRASGTWDLTTTAALKNCIERFVSKFEDSIDRDRIYLMGFSIGASMTIKTVADYENYFAAAVPISAVDQTAATKITNTAVWFFANEKDSYVSANVSATRSTFNKVCEKTNDKSKIRFTAVTEAVDQYGKTVSTQHYMWRTVTNDMFMADKTQYAKTSTVDGNGNKISFTYPNGVISWLSAQTKTDHGTEKSGNDFWSKLVAFFKTLISFFAALFGA